MQFVKLRNVLISKNINPLTKKRGEISFSPLFYIFALKGMVRMAHLVAINHGN